MKKNDIDIYYDRRQAYPSINVKVNRFASGLTAEELNCSEETLEKALTFAYESAQDLFWEQAEEQAAEIFGNNVKVYGLGRSSGHLCVDGLDPVESWNAIMVSKWGRFVRYIENEIRYQCNKETVKENIEANRWNEEGAEKYNFYEKADKTSVCISEMKKQATNAGYGIVIR